MSKMKMKILMSFLLIMVTMMILPIASGQSNFVLITIQKGDTFVYQNVQTGDYTEFTVTNQNIFEDKSSTSAIFVNTVTSNDTFIIEYLPDQFSTSETDITLGKRISSSFIFSGKGNLLVSASEQRIITAQISNGTNIFSINGTASITYSFDSADRALATLTGNPIIDRFTVNITFNNQTTGSTTRTTSVFRLGLTSKVVFIPSPVFNFTYDSFSYGRSANITEDYTIQNVDMSFITVTYNYVDSNYTGASNLGSYSKQDTGVNFTFKDNLYVFAEDIGLPVFIEIGTVVPTMGFVRFKTSQAQTGSQYIIDDYSWKDEEPASSSTIPETKSTNGFGLFALFTIPILLYTKRKK